MRHTRRRTRQKKKPPLCPRCGGKILRAVWDGREVLLDPAPAPEPIGGFLAYQSSGGTWIARVIVTGHRHPTEKPYAVHAIRCTHRPEPRTP
ncbi:MULTISPECIES: hypothetical protein [Actinocorallia]|uniref:Uncharacterized protein n=2 Tax=Actinocorallia TaxID=58108 RepID=A0ABP6GY32_9ACTN